MPGVRNISGNMVLFPCSRFHTLSSSSYMNEFSASCITVEETSPTQGKSVCDDVFLNGYVANMRH